MKMRLPSIIDRSYHPFGRGWLSLRQFLAYLGPGFFVTVGFIDPGNWATNIAAGSEFNYNLLWIVTLSTAILILWQHISAHLGIVTGKCLAEAIADNVHPVWKSLYGVTAMAATVATALAEILGGAVGLNLLFHLPLQAGAALTAAFVVLIVWFHKYDWMEKLIVGFVSAIGLCYIIELYIVKPDWAVAGYHMVVPELSSSSIVIAMGVLGAVVMPHNMYLHSEVIQSRQWKGESEADTRRLLRYEFLDTLVAMLAGLAINAAMIIVAAAVFHRHGLRVTELTHASDSLRPLAGPVASILFGIGLLFSGFSSSTTAGIAGGTTFSGYLGKATDFDSPWFRGGLILTIIPAFLIILGIKNAFQALIISQVCLSVQLPLTMLPLFLLTVSRRVMGKFVNGWFETVLMVISGLIILVFNALLIYQIFGGKF